MKTFEDFNNLAKGLIDINSGVNKLAMAKEGLKTDMLFLIISNLILGAVCIGIMYLRFRVFGGN